MTAGPPEGGDEVVRLVAHVRGRVQGVGFRWWTRARALELGLTGYARNCPDGRVEVLAQGSREACEALLAALSAEDAAAAAEGSDAPARPGHVTGVGAQWLDPVKLPGGFRET